MFDDLEYKHTARVRKDSWFIRLYCWMWWAEPEKVDFCKLFWGYAFAIPNLFVRVVLFPLWLVTRPVFSRIDARMERREQEKASLSWEDIQEATRQKAEASKAREERVNAFFARVGAFATKVGLGARWLWKYLRYVAFTIFGAAGVAGGAALAYCLYLFADALLTDPWSVLTPVLIVVGVVMVLMLAIIGVAGGQYFFEDTPTGKSIRHGVKGGALTFGGAIRHGIRGLKTNTCPKIELVDDRGIRTE